MCIWTIPPKKNFVGPPSQKLIFGPEKKNIYIKEIKKIYPPINFFFSLHGNGDTIRIGREIQCLPYSRFFNFSLPPSLKKSQSNIEETFHLE